MERTEIKMSTASTIGSKLEDMAEAAQGVAHRLEGAHGALVRAGQQMEALLASADTQVDAGELGLDEARLVKVTVTKCIAVTAQAAREALQQSLGANGRVAGLRSAVAATKVIYDAEASRLRGNSEGTAHGRRQAGVRPVSKLAERRAEAEAAKAEKL